MTMNNSSSSNFLVNHPPPSTPEDHVTSPLSQDNHEDEDGPTTLELNAPLTTAPASSSAAVTSTSTSSPSSRSTAAGSTLNSSVTQKASRRHMHASRSSPNRASASKKSPEPGTEMRQSRSAAAHASPSPPSQTSHTSSSSSFSSSTVITLRTLLNSKGAGVIIGKAGKTVEELREMSGAKAGVSKAVDGVNDRILTVSGTTQQVAKAYYFIAKTLVATPTMNFQQVASGDKTTIRLLIPNLVMGAIIGRSGQRIKQVQDNHSVRLVASKESLPNSTERIMDLTGAAEGVQGAVRALVQCFAEEWDRIASQNVRYDPHVRMPTYFPHAYSPPTPPAPQYAQPPTRHHTNGSHSYPTTPPSTTSSHASSSREHFHRTGRGEDFTDDLATKTLPIPSDMVGCIIGRGGSRIGKIRQLSGSRISISKLPNDQGERLFTIVGTLTQNERALKMLYQQLSEEKERRLALDNDEGEPDKVHKGVLSAE